MSMRPLLLEPANTDSIRVGDEEISDQGDRLVTSELDLAVMAALLQAHN